MNPHAQTGKAACWLPLLLGLLAVLPLCAQDDWRVTQRGGVRFAAYEVFVDSGAEPLAAWQLEIRAAKGDVKITGIEGGEHAAFRQPPHHDPKAIQRERVKLAAFSTAAADRLPKGRTRVATVHVQVSGRVQPEFTVKVEAAANAGGKKISMEAVIKAKESK